MCLRKWFSGKATLKPSLQTFIFSSSGKQPPNKRWQVQSIQLEVLLLDHTNFATESWNVRMVVEVDHLQADHLDTCETKAVILILRYLQLLPYHRMDCAGGYHMRNSSNSRIWMSTVQKVKVTLREVLKWIGTLSFCANFFFLIHPLCLNYMALLKMKWSKLFRNESNYNNKDQCGLFLK